MSKFILQVTFDNNIQDLLLRTQDYCYKFSDRDNDYANKHLLTSLVLGYDSGELVIRKPISRSDEYIRNLAILTLQYVFQIPLTFEQDGDKSSIEQVYAQYITTELPADKELHIVAYMSLENTVDIAYLESFLNSFPQNLLITVDIILLPVNLKKRVSDSIKIELKNNLERLILLKNQHADIFGNIYYSQTIDSIGAAHEFSLEEQIKVFGSIILSLINGYDCVSCKDTEYPVTVVGLSSVGIDKFTIINNWAQVFLRGLIAPLIESDSNNYTIDVNKVQRVLSNILNEEKALISKMSESDSNELKIADSFKKKILAIIVESDLNPKERKYLLESCLELSKRTPESIETLDVNSIAVPDVLFVDLLSDFCGDAKYQELVSTIKKIQSLKDKISNQEELIERKKALISENYPIDGELTEDGFIIHGNKYKPYAHTEEPLESDYSATNVNLSDSADLRKYFSVIKDQGEQGACASFSLVSVFEYFLANETSKAEDLSEAFVYYNARERIGEANSDNGTTLQNIIKTMTDNGVCIEELCPYDDKEYSQKPTDEAYSDGVRRKVTSALNVPIEINTIKSAINEGYPVVASFRVFDSLAKSTAGFVSIPNDKERSADKKDYHAMVICGYSDKQGYFIVRNSWGAAFGDNGYCYLPYAYVRDLELTRYACVITGINTNTMKHNVGDFRYNYLDQDNNIQYAILKNQLIEEQHHLSLNRDELKAALNRYLLLLQSIQAGECIEKIKEEYASKVEQKEKEIADLISQNTSTKIPANKIVRAVLVVVMLLSLSVLGVGIYKYTQVQEALLLIIGTILSGCSILGIIFHILKNRKQNTLEIKRIGRIRAEIENLQMELAKKIEVHKLLTMLISNVNTISENSIMRKELLLSIESILSEAYEWISRRLKTSINPIEYPEIYKKIINLFKDKWNLLTSLLVDGIDKEKIQSIFHVIQKEILLMFNAEFDLKIEDEFGPKTENWKKFKRSISDTIVLAQLYLTGNEPCCSVFFSNINGIDIQNCYPIYVNNNQYLYLFLRRVQIDNIAIFREFSC